MNILFRVVGLIVLVCGDAGSVYADEVTVSIEGNIYIPPCKINDDAVVNVSFDKISLQKVDGVQSAVIRTLNLTCTSYQGTPYIVVSGNAMGNVADNNVLDTTGENAGRLGIALYQGSGVDTSFPLKIGVGGYKGVFGYPVARGLTGNGASGQFTFTAVPWKGNNTVLQAKKFSATMTMSISYL
ncbi:fimbrial protein [Citrobacter sp. Cpo071]|uniref:fimbrial protein n=1 Tax=Citrobacter sp. Cpo071 TaxID=2985133 RepID=UPI002577ED96|nr:fimbrial protein [Citrobacter sp. Cpo071]MDM2857124.1 fimbrial protein [Citrobacter sp. Cpo071]MDM2857219.1 fimbrial protein [Citrobacter sp. Cpo071]